MPVDPLHRWIPEPSVDFQLSADLDTDDRLPNQYRLAAVQLMRLLHAIDQIMIDSRNPTRDWWQISLALKLPSADFLELTEAEIAQQYGLTKMAISKRISKLRQQAGLKVNPVGYNGLF
jgi:hypothetical protein